MRLVSAGLAVAVSNVSLDHPGWLRETCGRVRRAFRFDNTVCTAICEAQHVTFEPAVETGTPADATTMSSLIDWFDSASLPASFRATVPFWHDTRVQRVRNPDLWDALLPPIFRQRRRAQDVESLYRRFCINHGSIIATTAGLTLLPPTPETVAGLPDDAFIQLGMRDKRRPLRAAAEACLNRASEWDELPPGKLFAGLQTVRHVGRWTAGAAVADHTNDYSFYTLPVDVAYRQWKEFLAPPSVDLSEQDFVQAWATLHYGHRSTLIALILAAPHRRRTADRLVGGTKPTARMVG